MDSRSGAGVFDPDKDSVRCKEWVRVAITIPFNESSSNRKSSTEDGAKCNSAKVKSRTAGSDTLSSRFGGDWSADNIIVNIFWRKIQRIRLHTQDELD